MIARIWRGAVRADDGDAYVAYMSETGIPAYARTSGNRGTYMLRRDAGERCEIVMVTFWSSLDAVKAFAGDDYETAVFYPEDDRFLVERDETSTHFALAAALPTGVADGPSAGPVRLAGTGDAAAVGRLLHEFNSEYDDFTPGPDAMAARIRALLEAGEITVLLAGPGPDGLAVLRYRPALWWDALDAYLEELYVVPARRGEGLGRALVETAVDLSRRRGARYMHVGTGEDDVAARALYERLGFDCRGGKPDGGVNFFYEREL